MKDFKWTVEFTVSETWVADGFNLTDDRAQDMIEAELGWATSAEVSAKVIKRPKDEAIAKAQGYPSVKAMREAS